MEKYGIQDYWYPGKEPTDDGGYVTFSFKDLKGRAHKVIPLQYPEIVKHVANIYEANLDCQRRQLAREVGPYLSAEDLINLANNKGWGAKVCAVVDRYKIIRILSSGMAELVAEAVLTYSSGYSIFALGLGKHDMCLYLARECKESEAHKLKENAKSYAKKGKHKDKERHGGKNHHGRGGHDGGGRQPSGEGQGNGGPREPSEGGRSSDGGPPSGEGQNRGRSEEPGEGGHRDNSGQHGRKGHGGRERGGRGSNTPRASSAKPPSIAEAIRTVNAGHWQRSKGPWAFGGVAGASGAGGGHDARRGPPPRGECGSRGGPPGRGREGGGGGYGRRRG